MLITYIFTFVLLLLLHLHLILHFSFLFAISKYSGRLQGLFIIILHFNLLVLGPSDADAVIFWAFFGHLYLFHELFLQYFVGIQLRLDVGVHHGYREVLAFGGEEAIGVELCEIF